ncbi:hypothetical protein LTR62_005272 [Meristemomyces frigidus]|uniref:CP-type G domain-containing protein n=1 Tax=Meristemomyces frigidus TaxID=1508187 RepID=A0AAN7YFI6_9PEZI|nr:hypothetical protein LTR62_005272 [Meristemomyces frigidus]
MGLPKSKNAVGLGNSLMNDRFGRNKKTDQHRTSAQQNGSIVRRDQEGNEYVTPGKKEADWVKMRSVTEQGALDEFLSTAELAGTDFTAEKMNNVKIIHVDQKNPYLLSREEERGVVRKQNAKRARLTVPRRPKWDKTTTARELDEREKQSILEWRRGLAELQEVDDLLMTPFERNLEVWRQLWRVIERSDLVVQIVDARNPLLFRCEDLEKYVKEVDKRKRNLLLVNKADMMTLEQRTRWVGWFVERGINFRFFSAELAREMNEARGNAFDSLEDEGQEDEEDEGVELDEADIEEELDGELGGKMGKVDIESEDDEEGEWESDDDDDDEAETSDANEPESKTLSMEEQTRILTTEDLEELFLQHSPKAPTSADSQQRKTQIGLVGYPNVGKSSTINALLGAKKVSVSATPGKTKHFQTIHLSDRVILCDCPGLVFPNFATTKAELVCAGVLPIDQLREYSGPGALVAQRIPQGFLEAIYGMKIATRPLEEGGTGVPTGEEVLRSYARARGFMTQGQGQPDEARAARSVLKDYVKGKLLFCHPPPAEPPIDGREFNRELYDEAHLPSKRRGAPGAIMADPALDDSASIADSDISLLPAVSGAKGKRLDSAFFAPGPGDSKVVQPFHHKYSQQGKELTGRKAKMIAAMEKGVDSADLKTAGKKHFKGGRRARGVEKTEMIGGRNDYD